VGTLKPEPSGEKPGSAEIEDANEAARQSGIEQKQSYTRRVWLLAIAVCVVAFIVMPPIIGWQRMSEERALSLSNICRIGQGELLYAQDWDSNTTPPACEISERMWLTWPRLLQPYVSPDSTFSNPSNPLIPFHSSIRDPTHDYPIDSGYAVNHRLWNTFSPGPFPLDNLELPEQTVLFVEAGRMWENPLRKTDGRTIGLLDYGDTTDRYARLSPYPSTHDGRMAVVAADGHGVLLTVQHYGSKDGPHDTTYGRLGSGIYNWNGGHPNGETDRPPKE
jgi:hypothetical protein